jgi:hypothetical protein
LTLAPRVNQTNHSDFQTLVCKNVRIAYRAGDVADIDATFKGVSFSGSGSGAGAVGLPSDVWSSSASAGEEAIEAFPDFAEIAGTAEEPLNGAQFVPLNEDLPLSDENSRFIGFGPEAPDEFRGVEAFFKPSVIITKVSYTTEQPTGGGDVGKIDNPGGPLQGNATGSQNWLKIQFSAEQFDRAWQITESWLRSGDKGWSNTLYG